MSGVVEVFQVDSFTSEPFGGNPAGVVVDAQALSEEQMRRIAAEMNVAETAFVMPALRPDADLRLRWFTPSGKEVTFCGHATVATVHVLLETGRLAGNHVAFDTLGGRLTVAVEASPHERLIWLEPALPALMPYPEPLIPILKAVGAAAETLASWAAPMLTPERDLLLPASGLVALKAVSPDLQHLARLGLDGGIRGFCLSAPESFDPDSLLHSRFFAPHYGIPEDPVTGSVHASLAVWVWQAGLVRAKRNVARFQAEQGDFLGRPGRLQVELHLESGQPARVRVGGHAVTVLAGSIRVA